MTERREFDAKQALEFLRTSQLVNLEMPLNQVVLAASQIEELAGYVIAWEKYVLVVAAAADRPPACPEG